MLTRLEKFINELKERAGERLSIVGRKMTNQERLIKYLKEEQAHKMKMYKQAQLQMLRS